MGTIESPLVEQMKRDGVEIPEHISNKPLVRKNLVQYIEAFWELDSERNHGMGLAKIPWSKIRDYADQNFMDFEETLFFIRRMDNAWLNKLARKREHENANGPSQAVRKVTRPD